jgi:bla regulator protein BlaR1
MIDHLWQSTLFVIVAWLATLALRQNAARVRCWLWTAASIKFLVPFSMLVALGERFQWRVSTAALEPSISVVMGDFLASPDLVIATAPASMPSSSPVWSWLLPAVWGVGAVLVLLRWWRQWLPIRAALRSATPLQLDAQYDADDLVVMSSPSMPEPAVVGIRRPRLLLPAGIVERLTPAQLRTLIVHERCHIRCHDNLAAAIHMVVEAAFWFHPAVWWIESRLVDERERACDEAVLRSGGLPVDYAEGILEVCRQSVGLRLACVSGVSGSNLRARVEAIMRNEIGRPMTRARRWTLAVAIVLTVGGPVAAGALTVQQQFETASVQDLGPDPRPLSPFEIAMEGQFIKRLPGRDESELFRVRARLHHLIQVAYNLNYSQIEGGPEWVGSDMFHLEAKASGPVTMEHIRPMLRSLLADRFKLSLRQETRTLPVYELVVADGGLKIEPMKPGGCLKPKEVRWDLLDWEAPRFFCNSAGKRILSQNPETRPRPRWPRVARIEAGGVLMSALIDTISTDVDRVILDKTGFTAPFNAVLDYAPVNDPTASGPTLFDAIQEQLGLRLVPSTGPVDFFVIDRVERPAQ